MNCDYVTKYTAVYFMIISVKTHIWKDTPLNMANKPPFGKEHSLMVKGLMK